MLVTAHNRGPEAATLHLLPTLWFRNTWSWGDGRKPSIARRRRARTPSSASGASSRRRRCCSARTRPASEGARSTTTSSTARRSDRERRHQVRRPPRARDPGGRSRAIRVRLTPRRRRRLRRGVQRAAEEADAFYATIIPPSLDADRTT
jgi:hypothetical protein